MYNMKYYYIHHNNFLKGWSIGDLFNSLLYLSQFEKKEQITLLTHESLVAFVEYVFPGLIDVFVFEHDNSITFISIHKTFIHLPKIIHGPLHLKTHDVFIHSDNKLLPDDSILFILNRSDQYLLNSDTVHTILKVCSNHKVYIRNVVDNNTYKKSFVQIKNCISYEENLMCLIESCMKKRIKIIMNRSGLVDALGYISKLPIFLLFPECPNWLHTFSFRSHDQNVYLKSKMNPNIMEYFLNKDNSDLEQQLKIFLNK